ncbi:MAG: hypothetical protein A3C30_01850 [Candidatus Levybacteria bacterium RIFCSPHIGHO2_02_FULL_40_18]|nr:MAG: hypothetical protein A2869_04230 [Candidatus Levybacteria bacterium RIFCSPHIGHO2_01_FULL_40_58]OGH26734.1 MAG: hypothetical protein A3C30_01850 [Candidatus Levybacteria bacterium RIFCSPHIGHO2_02_FULL_40_18]OGH31669.1 MAG: hypothetical protein A3E43_01570 [Candidatus Levybacteria bacterium RIFCSPHIGHO2_12_FULL_40_31]OGH40569.1 MAG: hypothetical protein A2894_00120 [Candidatus Levybacteria bacterium RIFCSPLOWO2_01_FULL_40_64]OGH48745.1 MAG: hypothetical protein A3I54_03745 [Candidatus Lev
MSSEIRRIYGEVSEARRSAFETHSKPIGYQTDRGISWYENELPTLNNKSFIDIVEEKLAAQPIDQPLKIVDIGCGNGFFLVSCALRWPGQVSCVGITAQEFPNPFLEEGKIAKSKSTVYNKGVDAVKIIKADVMDIIPLMGRGSIDVAVALQAFRYFGDPWGALKRVYAALKDDGVCLIDSVNFNLGHVNDPKDQKRIIDEVIMAAYLRNAYGMEFFAGDKFPPLSFKKTSPRLTLPIRYAGKMETDELQHAIESDERYQVVEYELDKEKASKYVPSASFL